MKPKQMTYEYLKRMIEDRIQVKFDCILGDSWSCVSCKREYYFFVEKPAGDLGKDSEWIDCRHSDRIIYQGKRIGQIIRKRYYCKECLDKQKETCKNLKDYASGVSEFEET